MNLSQRRLFPLARFVLRLHQMMQAQGTDYVLVYEEDFLGLPGWIRDNPDKFQEALSQDDLLFQQVVMDSTPISRST